MSSPVVLLGSQRFEPTLGAAMARLGVRGKVAIVTAGWQEREAEDQELDAHLGGQTVNLGLHRRADQLFIEDYELRTAHHERQEAMRVRRELYRLRLEHALEALAALRAHPAPRSIKDEQFLEALEVVRRLDRAHLAVARDSRDTFEASWASRSSLARHRDELRAVVDQCAAVAISGGHVATIVNRLFLFGFPALFAGKPLFAWTAGAMAMSERVVLFHDDAPVGPAVVEVLDVGLAVAPGVVVLPHPERRLDLTSPERVEALAQRFAPAQCVAFPARSTVVLRDGVVAEALGAQLLRGDGSVSPLAAAGKA